MLKKMLLGMFLAVVAMSATTEAAAMKFRGIMTGGTPSPQEFELSFNIADQAATAEGTTNTQQSLVATLTMGANTFNSNGSAVGNRVRFTNDFPTLPDQLDFNFNFGSGNTIAFSYFYEGTSSNALNLNNLYNYMYQSPTAPPAGFDGSGWTTLAVGGGFGIGATGGSIQAIPEPASMSVLAALTLGLGGFAARRRRLRK
jgi:hypothetical protein